MTTVKIVQSLSATQLASCTKTAASLHGKYEQPAKQLLSHYYRW
jgi:hypothetical protein